MSFLTELAASLSRVHGMVTPEEMFAYSSDADRIQVYRYKTIDFFNRFGLDIKPSMIKQLNDDSIIIPTEHQIHGGSISPRALDKITEEIKENQFVDNVEFDETTGNFTVSFLKHVALF